MNSKVLIVIGPSGVGKSAIFSALAREGLIEVIPTWTTRSPRHYESRNDADHVFVSEVEFLRHQQENHFMETVQLFGLDCFYGMPHLPSETSGGKIPVLMLRAMLLDRVARHVPDYVVYQVEAPQERVKAHMVVREEKDGSIGRRLDSYASEIEVGRQYASRIIDNGMPFEFTVALVRRYLFEDFSRDVTLA